MADKSLKSLAVDLAASIPDFAGKSASPLQSVWQEGEDVLLLCADGRKVRFNPEQVNRVMTYAHLPVHQPALPADGAKGAPSRTSSRRRKK